MKNCVGKDFGLIRVLNKPLPFRGKIAGNVCNDYAKIKAAIKSPQWPKSIVIDDAGYLITGQFMDGHSTTGKGNAVFGLYNQMADDFYRMIRCIRSGTVTSHSSTCSLIASAATLRCSRMCSFRSSAS